MVVKQAFCHGEVGESVVANLETKEESMQEEGGMQEQKLVLLRVIG